MKTWVLGDLHGEFKKLKTVLIKSGFDFEKDKLICLGDYVDRGPDPFKAIALLKNIKNVIFLRGNHDEEFICGVDCGRIHFNGHHGAVATIEAWEKLEDSEKAYFKHFFKSELRDYYVDEEERLFIHAGFNRHARLNTQHEFIFLWDRDLLNAAIGYSHMLEEVKEENPFKIKQYFKEIYLGHTPTTGWGHKTPMNVADKIWACDTGSGKGGKLTLMNIETKEFFQA